MIFHESLLFLNHVIWAHNANGLLSRSIIIIVGQSSASMGIIYDGALERISERKPSLLHDSSNSRDLSRRYLPKSGQLDQLARVQKL